MVRGAIDKEANDIQARLAVARNMESHVRSSATNRKTIEKPKLDNARRSRGIYFIDQADSEFKEAIQNRAKKLGSSDARIHALRDQENTVQGNLSHS